MYFYVYARCCDVLKIVRAFDEQGPAIQAARVAHFDDDGLVQKLFTKPPKQTHRLAVSNKKTDFEDHDEKIVTGLARSLEFPQRRYGDDLPEDATEVIYWDEQNELYKHMLGEYPPVRYRSLPQVAAGCAEGDFYDWVGEPLPLDGWFSWHVHQNRFQQSTEVPLRGLLITIRESTDCRGTRMPGYGIAVDRQSGRIVATCGIVVPPEAYEVAFRSLKARDGWAMSHVMLQYCWQPPLELDYAC